MINRLRVVVLAGATAAAATLPLALAAPAHAASPTACYSAARVICVDKSNQQLTLFEGGQAVFTMAVRFGAEDTPTRNGAFRIYNKEAKHVSRLAGSAMPYSLFFSGGEAIHYSADFAKNGYNNSSLGCVNTRDLAETKKLFEIASIGDIVYVYGTLPNYSWYDPKNFD